MLSFLHHPAAAAFGLTLLHALWQAALVAGLVALLHTQLTAARHRYATALAGLFLLPGLAVATFYYYYTPVAAVTPVDATQWLHLLAVAGPDAAAGTEASPDWRSWLPYLTIIYLLGLCLSVLRLAAAGLRLYFLRRRGIHAVDSAWRQQLDRLNHRYGIRPRPRLYLSERVDQVLSFGHFKPLILLPIGLLNQLTPAEVEAILLHELAHLQRRDYLWNWLQSAVETAYFFHPAVYWLGRRIRHERECCCDEWVAQRTDKTIYAQSLINLARFAQTPINQLAMYANSNRSSLGQRIERLFQPAARRRSVLPLLLLLIPFVLLAWRPIEQSSNTELAPEAPITTDDRPTATGNETLDLPDLAPQPTRSSAALPATATSQRRDRNTAAVYTLAPRELALLPVTEDGVGVEGVFRSLPTLERAVSPLEPPVPVAEVDTVPKWSGTFHPQTLFIIDGKRLPRGSGEPLRDLDPADIISIDVHKGAPAVDKFGADSQNGVVVITTRGAQQRRPQPATVPDNPKPDGTIRLRTPADNGPEPRYVIDGEMLPAGQALDLQPEEIESITVWKGESATERYGTAGANGVVDIKTKTGPDRTTPAPDAPIHLDADEQRTKVRIRSSEQQQPLFIIDGQVQPKGSGKPADLTPEEIESVKVLKGKAAVERFGSEATDGAVLIQTKATEKRSEQPRSPQPPRQEAKKLRFGPGLTAGDPDPLYVIDGEIQPDARVVESLDKNDIDRINVLKNEPARAIYGESIGDRTVIEIFRKRSAQAPAPRPAAEPAPESIPQPAAAPRYLSSTLYPNPTSGKAMVRFDLNSEERVVLDVFDAEGRRVLNRQFGRLPAGEQQLEFDTARLPIGTYTVTILAGDQRWKATLVRN